MHVAIITAGGAGMFCGSCMHDNTWARALLAAGVEVTLVPTYTPIRVDEPNQSESHVYFGGLNVYLGSRVPGWSHLPRWATRWLDRPGLIRWATRFSVSNEAAELGRLTLDMLAGEAGPHRAAGEELARHIAEELRPDVVIFSNALLVGALRTLRAAYPGPILCTLQGDDLFLDGLPDSSREAALQAISERSRQFTGFLAHSRFYQEYMTEYLLLNAPKFHQLPLSIDPEGHDGRPGERNESPFTVGYFARIAPEKGLHHLVDAFRLLAEQRSDVRLRIGGYLGSQNHDYFESVQRGLAGLETLYEYVGSPGSHEEKVRFYRGLDVLSVPTEFQEPKGLYVLEALANGVPVVQPAHGAFPELIEATGGGLLTTPRDARALAAALVRLHDDRELRLTLGTNGQDAIRKKFSLPALAEATLRAIEGCG
ncbi:MAG: glycosyltransferase family 4 protein [Planctomycetaceae bacterium]|nr:glycosyltransferase family 4 protein [Planctomycetaceae bacterium]